MHKYTNARSLSPGRGAALRRADLVWFTDISVAEERSDLDDNFDEENDDYDSDIYDKGGLFPMI